MFYYTSCTDKTLLKSRNAFFLTALMRRVGALQPAYLLDGQQWENVYRVGLVAVALSDTYRNPDTDKKSLTQRTPGLVTLDFITTEPGQRGLGLASAELRQLLRLADKWSVALQLRPMALSTGSLDDEQLAAWYGRHGFTHQQGLYLVRPAR